MYDLASVVDEAFRGWSGGFARTMRGEETMNDTVDELLQ